MSPRISIDAALAISGTIAGVAGMIWLTHAPYPGERPFDDLEAAHRVAEPFSIGTTARDEQLNAMAADPANLARGAKAFQRYCVSCHARQSTSTHIERLDLFDEHWYHGATPARIEQMAQDGFPPAGMIGWKGVVPDAQLTAAVAFLVSKQSAFEDAPSPPASEQD